MCVCISGRGWFEGFLSRNPDISLRKPQKLGKAKADLTDEKICLWFKDLEEYLKTEWETRDLQCWPTRDESTIRFVRYKQINK